MMGLIHLEQWYLYHMACNNVYLQSSTLDVQEAAIPSFVITYICIKCSNYKWNRCLYGTPHRNLHPLKCRENGYSTRLQNIYNMHNVKASLGHPSPRLRPLTVLRWSVGLTKIWDPPLQSLQNHNRRKG